MVLLYHHTNDRALPAIRRQGLTKGLIVLDDHRTVNAISLTSSATPEGLGLNLEDEPLTDADRKSYQQITGVLPARGAKFGANGNVRITVNVPETDDRLWHWRDYRRNVERRRLHAMETGARPETWWVFLGQIPLAWFTAIHYRHGTEYREAPRADPLEGGA